MDMRAWAWMSGLLLVSAMAGPGAGAGPVPLPAGTVYWRTFEGGGAGALALMLRPGQGRPGEIMVVRPGPRGDRVLLARSVPGTFTAQFSSRPIIGPRIAAHDHLVVFAERVATPVGPALAYQVVRVFPDRAVVLRAAPPGPALAPFGAIWVDGSSIEVSALGGIGWFRAYTLTFRRGTLVRRLDQTLPATLPPGFGRITYTSVRYAVHARSGTTVRYAWLSVEPRRLTMYTGETLYVDDRNEAGGGVSVKLRGDSLKAVAAAVQGSIAFQARRVGESVLEFRLGGTCACGVIGSRAAVIRVDVKPPMVPGGEPVQLARGTKPASGRPPLA